MLACGIFALGLSLGMGGVQLASAGDPHCYYYKMVTEYRTVQEPYTIFVAKYRPCGTPYQVALTQYRTVQAPYQRQAKVYCLHDGSRTLALRQMANSLGSYTGWMENYRIGAHSRIDLKYHFVWVTKYRKRVLHLWAATAMLSR